MSFNRAPLSLANRVMLFVAVAVLLCALLLASMLQNSIEQHFSEQDAGELQAVAHSVLHALEDDQLSPQNYQAHLHQVLTGHHQSYYLVLDSSAQPALSADGADLTPLLKLTEPVQQIRPTDLVSWQQDNRHFRGAILQGNKGVKVAVAMEMEFHLHYLHLLRWTLWLTITAAVAVILLAAWFGVRQGLQPLAKLSSDIRHISAEHLHLRLEPSAVPRELRELVESFNEMINNLQQGFTRLSEFSADIAHELRTPLSNLITQTQVTLGKERSLEEYRELLYSNLEEQERLAKMVSDMLWLAKTDHGLLKLHPQQVALQPLINQLFEFFELLADEKQVRLSYSGPELQLSADKVMLQRALSNLLSNAIRHADAGSTVGVTVSQQAAYCCIQVSNCGTTIPAQHLPSLFDRFYRVDPSRQRHSEGAGLGLAMVKSIVELHGGQVAVSSEQGLTCFSLTWPVSGQNQPPQP
ncbi:heavy metal sensor histidine kinase [Rheinheimera sp. 4Y26]|uniref:heavy metal sensor histidine kinase n=1 Tax=Rheinheimera sp. 4Y26 TaxID=2977811 RepID=UPI0021B13B48|nr:heavy metal sensor histidine kinase [Rheinheimera sp. 4Y26]MCT6701040.1 heavy metal sensor histidine kinase [Rheinheimera sp. 4Y26]